jgi:hypothetical protein
VERPRADVVAADQAQLIQPLLIDGRKPKSISNFNAIGATRAGPSYCKTQQAFPLRFNGFQAYTAAPCNMNAPTAITPRRRRRDGTGNNAPAGFPRGRRLKWLIAKDPIPSTRASNDGPCPKNALDGSDHRPLIYVKMRLF